MDSRVTDLDVRAVELSARWPDADTLATEYGVIVSNPIFGICRVRERKLIWVNRRIEEMTGYPAEALVGRTTMRLYRSRADYFKFGKRAYGVLRAGGTFLGEAQFRHKEGGLFWARLVGRLIAPQRHGAPDSLWIIEDVDGEKRAIKQLRDRQRRFRDLVQNTSDWIWETDANAKFDYSNKVVEELIGYSVDEVLGRSPFDFMVKPDIEWAKADALGIPKGAEPSYRIENRFSHKNGHVVDLEARIIPIHGEKGEVTGFRGITRDITERRHAEVERRHFETRVRDGLFKTVGALGHTVEVRDPYTAGHQKRVAALATAIATELGLPRETVIGIEVGGLVHDIGKIHIPSEILTRPGRFTVEEMNLVRTHPQIGYDIVKDIELPWPVAEMVLQHHERLDGSGYPQGLKGDAICREAQIIAVADVVEAISSHRPYRPALGVEVGLDEIVKHRGTYYAADAVDACVRLIREKGFTLD